MINYDGRSGGRIEDGNRLVDALLRAAPGHLEGTRPVHAKGICVEGSFQPTEIAAQYCTAKHFNESVPVTVRFSNSTGLSSVPDIRPDVRGMAVKFHLGDGVETDLIAINVPVFPARTVQEFLEFVAAGEPVPVRPQSRIGWVLDHLALRVPPPEPATPGIPSGEPGIFRFAVSHPFASQSVLAASMAVTPVSYARMAYHAIHAFRISGPDEVVRSVRFHWDPVAGVRPVGEEDLAENYLQTELGERLTEGPVEFVLRIQVAETGDDTSDPSRAWPWRRPLLVMGKLSLSTLVKNRIADCEHLSFNPARLVPGIEYSDDQILAARGPAYEASYERRIGRGCPFM